jgi:hypothetical protein
MTRLVTPWATPVSTMAVGRTWATMHQIASANARSPSFHPP